MNHAMTYVLSLSALCLISQPALADESQVREFMKAYVDAFNRQDADAVMSMWTENCSHCNEDTGERTEGRAEVLKDLPVLFAAEQKTQISGTVDHIRLVTPEIAQVTGTVSVGAEGALPEETSFSAIVLKQGDAWRFDSVEESRLAPPATAGDALDELAWLEGSWVDNAEAGEIVWTFRWSTSGRFLTRVVTQADGDELVRLGSDIIGWDPRSLQIRSWSFQADGSFGDAVWSHAGDEWVIRSSQTLADGQASSGTYVVTRNGDKSVTVKLVGHEIEGEPQPSSEPITMTRLEEGDEAAAAETAADAAEPKPTGR